MREELKRIGEDLLEALASKKLVAIYSGVPGKPEVEFQLKLKAFEEMFGDDYTLETTKYSDFVWRAHYEGKIKFFCANE